MRYEEHRAISSCPSVVAPAPSCPPGTQTTRVTGTGKGHFSCGITVFGASIWNAWFWIPAQPGLSLIHSFIHSLAGQSLPDSYPVAGMAPGTEVAPVIKGKSRPPELTF